METNAMNEVRNVRGDMSSETRDRVTQILYDIIQNNEAKYPQTLARELKEHCDDQLKGTWHCHVGPSFGSSFPFEKGSYYAATYRDQNIVLYKYALEIDIESVKRVAVFFLQHSEYQSLLEEFDKTETAESKWMNTMSDESIVKNVGGDMSNSKREEITNFITQYIKEDEQNATYPQNLSRRVKEHCDAKYGGTWYCHVGPSFGRFVANFAFLVLLDSFFGLNINCAFIFIILLLLKSECEQ
ncbi:unnamed protein product [Dibothriocephalus latus]|uniref:Dynein light chain n=1 Tax=Dibothriocephalus latus TaxID=60516 RepID=A0A3P7NUP4_DIBLA|nr:unnamed protein product [Dibothriocephalus latus]